MRRVILSFGILAALLCLPGTALAAGGWTTPRPADPVFPSPIISCHSISFCAAVDKEGDAATYNGTTWTLPSVIDNVGKLTSISCPTSSFCIAVDSAGNALKYTSGAWSEPITIDSFGGLSGVSCSSTNFCIAVNEEGEAVNYRNGAWEMPQLIDNSGFLSSVSCESSSFCAAVDQNGQEFIYNGSLWSESHTDLVSPLVSVSCPTSSFCVAVDRGTHFVTYKSGSWNNPVSVSSIAGETLASVSCTSTLFCVTAGNKEVAHLYNGTTWSATGEYNPYSIHPISSVSCVGEECIAGNDVGGIYKYSATHWGSVPAVGSDVPVSVSCVSSSFCNAIDENGRFVAYRGSGWSVPASIDALEPLTSVSCSSSAFCAAVGGYDNREHGHGVTILYNGSTWSTPAVIGAQQLLGVSCASSHFCVAVQRETVETLEKNLTFVYNGTSWSSPGRVPLEEELSSISCPSEAFCVAVGKKDEIGGVVDAASIYRNGTWGGEELVGGHNGFTSVSCESSAYCVAVDQSGEAFTYLSGVWQPGVAIDTTSFSVVSCPSSSFCAAVDIGGRAFTDTSNLWSSPFSVALNGLSALSCGSAEFCASLDTQGNAVLYSPSSLSKNTFPPTLSGTPQVGSVLTESHGTWTNNPTSFTYQWEKCVGEGSQCAVIPGATAQSFTLEEEDVRHTIRVQETAINSFGESSPAASVVTKEVQAAPVIPPPAPVTAPTISGVPVIGTTLTASPGGWSGTQPITYSYQWERCNPECFPIVGQITSTFTLSTADLGHAVRVEVTATNVGGSSTAVSAQLGPIGATSSGIAVTLSGGGVIGTNLTAPQGVTVADRAKLSGAEASGAGGTVTYSVYKSSKCTGKASSQSVANVENGVPGSSKAVKLAPGTYYWTVSYSGDSANLAAKSPCGSQVLIVAVNANTLGLPSSKACLAAKHDVFRPRAPKRVKFVSMEVQINGKRISKNHFSHSVGVNLTKVTGTFRLALIAVSSKGVSYEEIRVFHICATKKKK